MNILAQLITSFIATGAFGIIFNAPKNMLIKCGLIGMGGWLIYYVIEDYFGDAVLATWIATIFIAVVSHVLAKFYKTPVIIFSVAGIIPLVPGGLAYDAMRNFVENDYNQALGNAANVLMLSGAIAFGLIFSEVLNQVIRKIKHQRMKLRG
ncbi:threonine/serine exporter family protein [Neobacillus cucumis]|uniref:threonine/serine exporter family protein n=1 Tax=Neobacillus cucumis TaxID=1740721 RepID=UPI0018DFDB24|nr:threonine/serine exporter family protein [Neobacillus cucumis]MBI0578854.1 threonine/serine exporter family protein [Neobacillus cucumis]WHY92649.1 threonine/serine exporter family protein [Neobacillus cucumis]